jgi:hypothetical protein
LITCPVRWVRQSLVADLGLNLGRQFGSNVNNVVNSARVFGGLLQVIEADA